MIPSPKRYSLSPVIRGGGRREGPFGSGAKCTAVAFRKCPSPLPSP